jgi:hypothetical protein
MPKNFGINFPEKHFWFIKLFSIRWLPVCVFVEIGGEAEIFSLISQMAFFIGGGFAGKALGSGGSMEKTSL